MINKNCIEVLQVVKILAVEIIEVPILCPKHQLKGGTFESVSIEWMLVNEVLGGSDPHLGCGHISLG